MHKVLTHTFVIFKYTHGLRYATSTRFAVVVGLLGGFATILTNSMGPLLNVYLLAHRYEPKVISTWVPRSL